MIELAEMGIQVNNICVTDDFILISRCILALVLGL